MEKSDADLFKEAFPFMYEKQRRRESAVRQGKQPLPDDFYAITFNEAPIQTEQMLNIVDPENVRLSMNIKGSDNKS